MNSTRVKIYNSTGVEICDVSEAEYNRLKLDGLIRSSDIIKYY